MESRQGRCPECSWDFPLDEYGDFEAMGRHKTLHPHQNILTKRHCLGSGKEPTIIHLTPDEELEQERDGWAFPKEEIKRTKNKLSKLSFGEEIVFFPVEAVDSEATQSFIYKGGDSMLEVPGINTVWFVKFDKERVYFNLDRQPANQEDYNGTCKVAQTTCCF